MVALSTKELCDIAKVDKTTLYRWEKDKLLKPSRDDKGHRLYTLEDMTRALDKSKRRISTTVAVINQKGGVGKTSISYNLAACFAEFNQEVLVVDLDSQAALTMSFDIKPDDLRFTVYDLLVNKKIEVEDVVKDTDLKGVKVLPSNIVLADADVKLASEFMAETILRRKLLEAREKYNIILLDAPPNLGIMAASALLACDTVLIPVGLNEYSFLGLGRLAAFLATIRERSGREDIQISVVPNFFDERVKLPKEFLQDLKDNFTVGKVLGSIRVCQAIPDSQHYKVPVTAFKKKGARKAQEDFRRLAIEVLGI